MLHIQGYSQGICGGKVHSSWMYDVRLHKTQGFCVVALRGLVTMEDIFHF